MQNIFGKLEKCKIDVTHDLFNQENLIITGRGVESPMVTAIFSLNKGDIIALIKVDTLENTFLFGKK